MLTEMIAFRLAWTSVLGVLCLAPVLAAPIKRAKDPAPSPDGSRIAFSWQGDIWVVPRAGGRAERLTVHPANDIGPRWSPDGSRLYFSSDRHGSLDLFSMTPDGRDLRRLTFDSASEYVNDVSPDGRVLFGYSNALASLGAVRVPAEGGDLAALTTHPRENAFFVAVSKDGRTVAYCTSGVAGSWRKPSLGGAYGADIWIADNTVPLTRHRPLVADDHNNLFPAFLPDGSLLYVSNRGGWPNIWRVAGEGARPRQITQHAGNTIRGLSVSADGKLAAYQLGSEIWLLNLETGQARELVIEVPADERANPVQTLELTSGAEGYAISPDGKRAVIVVRGDLFLIPEQGGTTRQLTTHPARDFDPVWLDEKTILFVTGRNAKRELMTVDLDGRENLYLSDESDLASPRLSPDRKHLAYLRGPRQIVVRPLEGGEPRVVLEGPFIDGLRGAAQFTWSPDSRWIAAVQALDGRAESVEMVEWETGRKIEVARLARGAGTPVFLADGSALVFTGSQGEGNELFIVDLVPRPIVFREDDLDRLDAPAREAPKAPRVQVYEPGLERRLRSLATGVSGTPVSAPDSKAVWINVDGQLSSVPVDGERPTPVSGVTGAAASLSLSGQKLYFLSSGGALNQYSLSQRTVKAMPYTARLTIDRRAEERALFDEIWWSMDRFYYDPRHHGKSWSAIKEEFSALVPHAFDRADFYALMHEMMERLDSSHVGATPPRTPSFGDDATAELGVRWDWRALAERRQYLVADVIEESPADHPESRLRPGDRLVSVDGVALGGEKTLAELLNQKAGRKVRLEVERDGRTRMVEIRPVSRAAMSDLVYESWVARNRKIVEERSGGLLTYVHIEGMNPPSHRRFLREIRTLTPGRQGLLIDVRFNGGGSTAHEALGVLIKTPWLKRTFRGYDGLMVSENIYRGDSLEMPSALLINEYSFSNAEIFAEGFRRLKIGPVIGEQTAGGVIGTSSLRLWDGGSIRMPANGAFTIDGENLENNGRRPDVRIPFDPNAWLEGRDVQLERAVDELMKIVRSAR